MNNEISKKTFILAIVKLVLSVVGVVFVIGMPIIEGLGMWYFIYAYIVTIIGAPIAILYDVLFFIPMLVFTFVVLIKNILFFVSVMKVKNGKQELTVKQWNKKICATQLFAVVAFYIIPCLLFMGGWASYHFYLSLALAIADVVVLSMFKKSMGIVKGKKGGNPAPLQAPAAEATVQETPAAEEKTSEK